MEKGRRQGKNILLESLPQTGEEFSQGRNGGETGAYAVPRDVMQELTASHTVSLLCQHKRVKTREISAKSGEWQDGCTWLAGQKIFHALAKRPETV
jgi:hypothetical protein